MGGFEAEIRGTQQKPREERFSEVSSWEEQVAGKTGCQQQGCCFFEKRRQQQKPWAKGQKVRQNRRAKVEGRGFSEQEPLKRWEGVCFFKVWQGKHDKPKATSKSPARKGK